MTRVIRKTIPDTTTAPQNGIPSVEFGRSIEKLVKQPTKANLALVPQVTSAEAFGNAELREAAFYADDNVLILNMDVRTAMGHLERAGVIINCMVTSFQSLALAAFFAW